MKRLLYLFILTLSISLLVLFTGQGCQLADNKKEKKDSLALKEHLTSPVLSPQESIKTMQLEDGLTVKLVAAEPLVIAPVAMTFDEKGRIWVAEMQSYMPDTLGTGEDKPTGKIVILSDKNNDGIMDERTVFLDSLVLPRALCLIEGGLLVGESPRLWYYEINNDKPGKRTLVDNAYTIGSNVEHEPNGLLRALDNWIYNAKFSKRYRKKGNQWLIENTHFRGQWGITQDDNGQLFYNNNSMNLLGDYFSPGLGATNKNQKRTIGFDEKIVSNNRVYPLGPTPGVNRGYMEGVLDDSLRLVSFTAACGPLIYRGNLLGKEYDGNAFVAEPAGNLIKRNILQHDGNVVVGKQAYAHKEFLASTDERFRPVNLNDGPDGALYVVDMYRGIIQDKVYLTNYLKSEINSRKLTLPLNCGRIYKIVPPDKNPQPFIFDNHPDHLVQGLQQANGWVRDKAQQLLIDGKYMQAVPALHQLLNDQNPLTVIHALWTLEGLGALVDKEVLPLLTNNNWVIRRQALTVIPSVINRNNYTSFLQAFEERLQQNDSLAAPYIAFLVHSFQPFNPVMANQFMMTLVKKYPDNAYVADAVISNLNNNETNFYKQVTANYPNDSLAIKKQLAKVLSDMEEAKKGNRNAAKEFPKGASIFQSVCQGCHGADGNGIKSLAPPLNNSNWVLGDKNKFIAIVLYGLTGPVQVGGKMYKVPEVTGEMPGIGENREFSNEDIAQVLNYVRHSWSNNGDKISAEDLNKVRVQYKGRQRPFTMEELTKAK